jgi:hypothetical protein
MVVTPSKGQALVLVGCSRIVLAVVLLQTPTILERPIPTALSRSPVPVRILYGIHWVTVQSNFHRIILEEVAAESALAYAATDIRRNSLAFIQKAPISFWVFQVGKCRDVSACYLYSLVDEVAVAR